jgi:nucleoside-diphosphate-sugar epimerase
MTILVTGANGWVGQAISQRLVHDGVNFRAAVRSVSSALPGCDTTVVREINDKTDWRCALKGINTVVHLASRVHVMSDTSDNPLSKYRQVNVQGTLHLARRAVLAGVTRYVFVSSVKVNGELTPSGHPFIESDQPNPQDPYGISKYEAEQGLQKIAAQTGLEVVIIRPPLVYGPGVKANFAQLIHAVQKGWPLPLGSIHNLRSLIALDNLVDFIITCTTHPNAAQQTFLISDGQDISTPELIQGMAKAAGVRAHILPVPVWILMCAGKLTGKSNAVQRLCGNLQIDSAKARSLLGWRPVVSFHEGLRQTMDGVLKS